MDALADYAKIVQENNMVPIVEPEVLMDGSHSIESCEDATKRCLSTLFESLAEKGVLVEGTILKPNMVATILGFKMVPSTKTPFSAKDSNRVLKHLFVASSQDSIE